MQDPLYKRDEDPSFQDEATQEHFVEDTDSDVELLQKELDVNETNQTLLIKRVRVMEESINDIPSFDHKYTTLVTQIQMDKIELDELKVRKEILINKLEEI